METARSPTTVGAATVGKYALVRELRAHGVAAFVGRPLEGDPNDLVAIERIGVPTAQSRASELVRLHHPNVARVRETVLVGGFLYLVNEYIDGATLAQLAKRIGAEGRRVPLEAQLRIVVDVLNGLSALHAHTDAGRGPLRLVHGSVSPHAAIVGSDGTTRLAWIGRPLAPKPSPEVVGYASPQVLGEAKSVDARADLYSVGVMLWEALAGKRLFPDDAAAVVAEHAAGPVARATPEEHDAWAAPLASVAARALETDPAARFATAAEMAAEIRKIAKAKLALPARVASVMSGAFGARIADRRKALCEAPPLPASVLPQPTPERPSAPKTATAAFSGTEAPTVPKGVAGSGPAVAQTTSAQVSAYKAPPPRLPLVVKPASPPVVVAAAPAPAAKPAAPEPPPPKAPTASPAKPPPPMVTKPVAAPVIAKPIVFRRPPPPVPKATDPDEEVLSSDFVTPISVPSPAPTPAAAPVIDVPPPPPFIAALSDESPGTFAWPQHAPAAPAKPLPVEPPLVPQNEEAAIPIAAALETPLSTGRAILTPRPLAFGSPRGRNLVMLAGVLAACLLLLALAGTRALFRASSASVEPAAAPPSAPPPRPTTSAATSTEAPPAPSAIAPPATSEPVVAAASAEPPQVAPSSADTAAPSTPPSSAAPTASPSPVRSLSPRPKPKAPSDRYDPLGI